LYSFSSFSLAALGSLSVHIHSFYIYVEKQVGGSPTDVLILKRKKGFPSIVPRPADCELICNC